MAKPLSVLIVEDNKMDGLEVLRQGRALVGECAWGSK